MFLGKVQEFPNKHLWTKAICDDYYCQDYSIECEGDKLIKMSPITGATIAVSDSWKDPRTIEERTRICD